MFLIELIDLEDESESASTTSAGKNAIRRRRSCQDKNLGPHPTVLGSRLPLSDRRGDELAVLQVELRGDRHAPFDGAGHRAVIGVDRMDSLGSFALVGL